MVASYEMVRRNFFPFRNDLFANFGAVSASGMEFAAFRRIYRAGDIAFKNLKIFMAFIFGGRNCVKKSFGIRMNRVIEDFLRICKLYHITEIHNTDSVGNIFNNRKVMGTIWMLQQNSIRKRQRLQLQICSNGKEKRRQGSKERCSAPLFSEMG